MRPCGYACDREGRLVRIDPAGAALLGGAPASLVGRSLNELCAPNDRQRLAASWQGAGPRALTWIAQPAPDAQRIPLLDLSEATADGWEGTLQDHRAAARAEAEAEEAIALRSQGELAASVAHEINNPLSGVLNYAQLAARLGAAQPALREALEGIESEARRIHELTRALLVHAPHPPEEVYPVQADALLRAVLAPRRRELREDLIAVEVALAPDLPPLRGQGLLLQAVLRQLLVNAHEALTAHFPPARDPAKRLVLRALAEPGGDPDELPAAVWLELENGGPGWPAAAGQPFFSTRAGRRGLGLCRAREQLEALGGQLQLVPATGGGALARCVVPVFEG